ncbi:hypothetical protein ACFVSU_07430 [Microbacterium sp. NPDC058062]|uniref:hypothetical protein n=1 Tax=Microbacterium sp. NPDC058062 TaxID=3346320 RepID=UPI0036DB8827
MQLVLELAQTPMTGRGIARITGVGRSTIARLMNAGDALDHATIREETLAAIRAAHAIHAFSSVQRASATSHPRQN